MERIKRKHVVKISVFVTSIFILFLSVSYALFSQTLFGQKNYSILSGNLKVYLNESSSNNIALTNVIPVSDEIGIQNESYNFSLVNEGKTDLEYTIYLQEEEFENKTPTSAIRYHYERDIDHINVTRDMEESKTEEGRFFLESGIIPANTTYEYSFKMWIGIHAGNEIMGTEYSLKLQIEAAQTITPIYRDLVLNGCDPILSDNLVPVRIEDDGTVKKASIYNEWYNYSKQEWANAVVLEDKNQEYNIGDVIPEANIQSYFVWIPRYKYKLFDMGNYNGLVANVEKKEQTIEVVFENKDVTPSVGTKVGDYHSHPAFQAFDTNGFWVGKFESGYKGATTSAEAQINSIEHLKLVIKPNVYSWMNISVANSFALSYNYLRKEESHMMKNTEWGAVAYLQHSDYGSRQKVRINNNSSYLTGYASVEEPTLGYNNGVSIGGNLVGTTPDVTQSYNTEIGYKASTTGNISGVYDMAGGAWEHTMGYNTKASTLGGNSGLTNIYGGFFTNKEWEKYYDRYSNPNMNTTLYSNNILGDATGEMGPFSDIVDPDGLARHKNSWYRNHTYFIAPSDPWFTRGGGWNFGSGAGVFTFSISTGISNLEVSFRVVLAP